MDILILRDPHESAVKCSLTPLRGLPGLRFVDFDPRRRLEAGERVLLHAEGEQFVPADRGRDLLLIDCSWRRVPRLERVVDGVLHRRRLPAFESAYPRRSKTFPDPSEGLASVEALYLATLLLGQPREELLAHYHWRDSFLERNRERLRALVGG